MKTKHIPVEISARVVESGIVESPDRIWIVLHGYGQLAPFFIRKFQVLESSNLILAPEGLHRFYLKGSAGRVGASWMTKEDRLTDISNYQNYLGNLILSTHNSHPDKEIVLLGFSQGAATASRVFSAHHTLINTLVLWSSVFPPDMDYEIDAKALNSSNVFMIYGDDDEYYSIEDFRKHAEEIKSHGIKLTTIEFEGPHNILADPLLQLEDQLKMV